MSQANRFQLDEGWQAVAACVDAFEESGASLADLRQLVHDVAPRYRRAALTELVKVDFERRWKQGDRRRIVDYWEEFPELGEDPASQLELLQEEFRLRSRLGDAPPVAEYRALLPEFVPPAELESTAGLRQSNYETVVLSEGVATPAPGPIPPTLPAARPSERDAPPVPDRIGKYRIVKVLGSGGFGVVYQGYDEQLERKVAIKVMKRSITGDGDDLLHEARAVANLNHPGIVKLLGADRIPGGAVFLVYDYVEGGTLENRIQRGDYNLKQAARWVIEAAEALHHGHKRDIYHRDIKPGNILVDGEGRVKLADYGLARRDGKFYINDRGRRIGTLMYMSPEQARGDAHWANAQSDVFSLGVVFYELLCKRPPFQSTDAEELLDQVQRCPPPPPRSMNDAISRDVERVCLKAMEKDPARRYTNGRDMATDLEKAIKPKRRWWKPALLSALSVVAVVALAVVANMIRDGIDSPPPPPAEITNFNLFLDGGSALSNERLPLTASDRLEIQATFDRPAYGYLLVYEQDGKARLLLPRREELDAPSLTDRLIYPPLAGDEADLSLPNAEGASLIVAVASNARLSRDQIDELLNAELTLGVSQTQAATVTQRQMIAEPAPKHLPDGVPLRSEGAGWKLRVPDEFKARLRGAGDAYWGVIVSHKNTANHEREE